MVQGVGKTSILLGSSALILSLGCGEGGSESASEGETSTPTSATVNGAATDDTTGTASGPDSDAGSATDSATDSAPSTTDGTTAGSESTGTAASTGTTDTSDTGTTGTTGEAMKPDDAPDWVVIAVSGHCVPPGCELPGTNHEYLTKVGTTAHITAPLIEAGYSVEVWAYADELYNRDAQTAKLLPGEGEPITFGFLQLHDDLNALRDAWIADFDDPTRVLVVAHSHGVVWAHTALHVVDDLPVELLVDLDGVSMGWEEDSLLAGFGDDWDDAISQYNQKYDVVWPFNIGDAEAGWSLPEVNGAQDVEDVIPDSVLFNLEVQADFSLLFPFPDDDDNHRLDGSGDGIDRYSSKDQDHFDIYKPNGAAMAWVRERMLIQLGL